MKYKVYGNCYKVHHNEQQPMHSTQYNNGCAFDDSLINMHIFVISLIDMFIFVISAGVEPKPASSPAWRLRAGVQLFRPVQQIPGTRRRGRCGWTDDPRHCSPVQL